MIDKAPSVAPALELDEQNPWPGLASFTEPTGPFFCGRGRESAELLRLVKRERLTVLYGQSGLGKSSLLQAGLFPRLREELFFPLYIRLDHSEGAAELREQIYAALEREISAGRVDAKIPERGLSLWEYFHQKDLEFWNERNRLVTPVLVFDQFEEIFTLGRRTEAAKARGRRFVTELSDLIDNRPPEEVKVRFKGQAEAAAFFNFDATSCKVILSLREDYMPDVAELPATMRGVLQNRMRIKPMDGQQALEVVLVPGKKVVDEDVGRRIVRYVAGASKKEESSEGKEPAELGQLEVEPSLLSVVCRELNNRRLAKMAEKISADLLQGHREEILRGFYERSMADVPEAVRTFVEERLVTKSGYRDSIALEVALSEPGIEREWINTLVGRRLLRLDDRAGGQRVELTHDVLAEPVTASRRERTLAREIAEGKRRFRRARNRTLLAVGAGIAFCIPLLLALWQVAARSRDMARTIHGKLVDAGGAAHAEGPVNTAWMEQLLAAAPESMESRELWTAFIPRRRIACTQVVLGVPESPVQAAYGLDGRVIAILTESRRLLFFTWHSEEGLGWQLSKTRAPMDNVTGMTFDERVQGDLYVRVGADNLARLHCTLTRDTLKIELVDQLSLQGQTPESKSSPDTNDATKGAKHEQRPAGLDSSAGLREAGEAHPESPFGPMLITGGSAASKTVTCMRDNLVQAFGVANGNKAANRLDIKTQGASSLSASANGKILFFSDEHGTRGLNMETYRLFWASETGKELCALDASSALLVVASERQESMRFFTAHRGASTVETLSPDRELPAAPTALAVSPLGYAAAGMASGGTSVLAAGRVAQVLPQQGIIKAVAFRPDGHELMTASLTWEQKDERAGVSAGQTPRMTLKFWSIEESNRAGVVAISPGNRWHAWSDPATNEVTVEAVDLKPALSRIDAVAGKITGLAVDDQGTVEIAYIDHRQAKLRTLRPLPAKSGYAIDDKVLAGVNGSDHLLALSPDGKRLAGISGTLGLCVLDTASGKITDQIADREHASPIKLSTLIPAGAEATDDLVAAFSADGSKLALANGSARQIAIVTLGTGQTRMLADQPRHIRAMAFADGDRELIVGTQEALMADRTDDGVVIVARGEGVMGIGGIATTKDGVMLIASSVGLLSEGRSESNVDALASERSSGWALDRATMELRPLADDAQQRLLTGSGIPVNSPDATLAEFYGQFWITRQALNQLEDRVTSGDAGEQVEAAYRGLSDFLAAHKECQQPAVETARRWWGVVGPLEVDAPPAALRAKIDASRRVGAYERLGMLDDVLKHVAAMDQKLLAEVSLLQAQAHEQRRDMLVERKGHLSDTAATGMQIAIDTERYQAQTALQSAVNYGFSDWSEAQELFATPWEDFPEILLSPDQLLQRALKLMDNKDTYAQAEHYLTLAAERKPADAEILLQLGVSQGLQKHYAAAEPTLDKSVTLAATPLDKARAMALRAYCVYYADRNQKALAMRLFDEAIRLVPDRALTRELRCDVYFGTQEYDKAIADYTWLIGQDPLNTEYWYNRAEAYEDAYQYEEAAADLREVVNHLDPNKTNAYERLGRILLKLNHRQEALAILTRMVDLDPKNVDAIAKRADVLRDYGKHYDDWSEAIKGYQRAIDLLPTKDVANMRIYRRRMGLCYLQQEDLPSAADCFHEVLLSDGNDETCLACQATIALRRGKLQEAVDGFTAALKIDATYAWAYRGRAMALTTQGKLKEAEADFDAAVKNDDSFAEDRAEFYANQGRFDDALKDLQAYGLAKDPVTQTTATMEIGQLDVQIGKPKEAQPLLEKSLLIRPSVVTAMTRSFVLAYLGKFQPAMDDAIAAQFVDPQNPKWDVLISQVYAISAGQAKGADRERLTILSLSRLAKTVPEHPMAWYTLASDREWVPLRDDPAFKLLEEALRADIDGDRPVKLARFYGRLAQRLAAAGFGKDEEGSVNEAEEMRKAGREQVNKAALNWQGSAKEFEDFVARDPDLSALRWEK